jgi:hypothetical protein
MLDRIPNLKFFSNAYWNQMGTNVFGRVEGAFRQFLADAARLPDGGTDFRRQLYAELMLILDSEEYENWLKLNRSNSEVIRAVGGRFLVPEDVRPLMAILDETFSPDT